MKARPPEFLAIIALLEWAGEKLVALNISSPKPHGYSVAWPTYALDPIEAYGYTELRLRGLAPTPFEIEAMDSILAWTSKISDTRYRRVVGLRSLIHPVRQCHMLTWARIAHIVGAAPLTAQHWYRRGVEVLVAKVPQELVADTLALLELRSEAALAWTSSA